jgi:hypothetical protein
MAALFVNAVRCHWHIENRLHWALAVIFREDLSRLRSVHGPHNMATVRHMVMNLCDRTNRARAASSAANWPIVTPLTFKPFFKDQPETFKRFP